MANDDFKLLDKDQQKAEQEFAKSRAELQVAKEAAVDAAFRNPDNLIVPISLDQEMKKSFIDYAMSVIMDRALPDVRDGLKPVHRRILYSMYTQGFTPDKPYRKCATTVGDVLGRFHPHGDASVYDALVRLAQDFSMRHPLVDGHGNFGSRDGDPAAAYRYTEARLTRLANEMMNNINKDTVDFRPNFDEHVLEPVVLPASYPNLLVNGSSGIAVGMATNIPPHNLGETIDAVLHKIDHPEASVEELMEFIQGPDFPTGAMILGVSGSRQAYRTGRGRVLVRAHAEIEEMRGGRHRIVVQDLPYQVNKARLIESIANLIKDKRIEGISDIRDESDRSEDVRIVIELKRDATPTVVLNQLYRHTKLQDSFNINMLALVPDGEGHDVPKVIGLAAALEYYLEHERTVVTRRTAFELEKAEARRHIVEGLQLAIDSIDAVINLIRSSSNENTAKIALCERFALSEKQAQHVVDMRLGRLSGLERDKLQLEFDELCERIGYYQNILADQSLLHEVIKDELLDIKKRYANPRRTVIELGVGDDIDDESLIEEEQVVITMSHAGYVKRMPVDLYSAQRRGGKGITGMQTRDEDFVETIYTTSTHDILLIFSSRGRVYKLKGYQIPESGRQARGTAFVNLLPLEPGEKVKGIIPISGFESEAALIMATQKGIVKKTQLSEYANIHKSGLIAINLREDDELVGVRLTREDHDIMLFTHLGMAIRFSQNEVRQTGRNTMGVKGITLRAEDSVIGMISTEEDKPLLCVSEQGFGRRNALSDYRRQARGGRGLICYRYTDKTGPLIAVNLADDTRDVLLINDLGVVIRLAAQDIPILGRGTRGVTLMRSRAGKVVDIAIVEPEEADSETASATTGDTASATASETAPTAALELNNPAQPGSEGEEEE